MRIRPYRREDEDKVIRLWTECGLVVSHNNPVRDIERKLRVNPEWFLVGEIDDEIVATCMAGYEGHRGWINYLAVAPARQRNRLATTIMGRVEELLREAGCPKINLQIRSKNQQVIEYYRSLGYRIDEVVSMGKRLEADEPHKVEQIAAAKAGGRCPVRLRGPRR